MGCPGGVPPDFVRVRRSAASRNRPLAALALGRAEIFSTRGGRLSAVPAAPALPLCPPRKTSCPPGDGRYACPRLAAPWPDSREAPRPPDGLAQARLRKDGPPMTLQTPAAPSSGARNADLADLAALLRDQQARKADFVAPAAAIRAHSGQLVIDDSAPMIGPDGVTMTSGVYTPTDVCDQGIADKLAIPAAYLRRLREQKPGLYDAKVNGWLAGDDRKFLLRCLRSSGPGGGGVVRAFLSDGYKIIDNLDVLLAVLDGVRQAGTPVDRKSKRLN